MPAVPSPTGAWAPSPIPRAIGSPRCWRCPSPGADGTLGVGTGVPREGLAEAGAWQWLEGAVVLGIRAVAASQSMSSASGQRVCQGPGLDRCPSPPQPALVPRVVTHRERLAGVEGDVGGGLPYKEVAQRWSGQERRMAVWDPPVGQEPGGAPPGQGGPVRWDGTPAATSDQPGAGRILTREVTLVGKI